MAVISVRYHAVDISGGKIAAHKQTTVSYLVEDDTLGRMEKKVFEW